MNIEDWDGDGAIRIPNEVLKELGVDVGDTLDMIEEYVGNARCLVISKRPQIPDRTDELVAYWSRVLKTNSADQSKQHFAGNGHLPRVTFEQANIYLEIETKKRQSAGL